MEAGIKLNTTIILQKGDPYRLHGVAEANLAAVLPIPGGNVKIGTTVGQFMPCETDDEDRVGTCDINRAARTDKTKTILSVHVADDEMQVLVGHCWVLQLADANITTLNALVITGAADGADALELTRTAQGAGYVQADINAALTERYQVYGKVWKVGGIGTAVLIEQFAL